MKKLIYIKVYRGYIEARTVGKNNEQQFQCVALNHPRSLADDFLEVEAAFKKAISKQPKVLLGLVKPKVLVHLVPKMEGGYTESERRFFRDAAMGADASEVYLLDDEYRPQQDHELSDTYKWE